MTLTTSESYFKFCYYGILKKNKTSKTKIDQLRFSDTTQHLFLSLSQEDVILLFTVNEMKPDAPGTKATSSNFSGIEWRHDPTFP